MKDSRLKKIYFRLIGEIKKNKLKVDDFTIISNNCFGGVFYRNNHLQYNSPTCGLAMMADDYIKFIYNMKHYLEIDEIREINIEESKYKDHLMKTKYAGVIGKLDDIELMFVHYGTIREAEEKWNRRKKRINYERIIYKFNDQNLCKYSNLKAFDDFKAKNKICFTAKKYDELNTIQLKKFEKYEYVLSDTRPKDYSKYFDIYKYINDCFQK